MKKVVLIGVPHHCNLGDHAIASAEKLFIERYFPDYTYTDVAEENVYKCIDKLKKIITDEDIIMLHGGGNFGSQYPFTEIGRRLVIQSFPNNNIILFPQTIFFEDTEKGQEEFEIAKKIYGNHNKLILIAREEKSYAIMRENFKNNKVFLTPDIVTILNEMKDDGIERSGALMILRDDPESKVSKDINKEIEKILNKYYINIERTDTAQGGNILGHQRKQRLNEMFDKYRKSEFVITDRLHGMIFAAITGTPCIALDNYNHKIKYTSKWLERFEYIRYIENYSDLEKIENIIKELKQIKSGKYDNKFALDIFDEIMGEINI